MINLYANNAMAFLQEGVWPIENTKYHYPVRLCMQYVFEEKTQYDRKDAIQSFATTRDIIIKDKNFFNKLLVSESREVIFKKYSYLGKNYLKYILNDHAGEEPYDLEDIAPVTDAGCIIVDKKHYILTYPEDNPLRWEVFFLTSILNKERKFLLSDPSGLYPFEPYGEGVIKTEKFKAGDPYFAQGLIRFLEQFDFKITSVTDGVDIPPYEPNGNVTSNSHLNIK
ncbi:MAG: hypothetical protein IPP74_08520 [Alphaproteobacteria bacterium]|nr:hypothetical protein [Alphaproteobacteria bacterium]